MKKVTSFTHFTTGEGERVAYTYSEIGEDGALVSQNNKGNFIVMDGEVQGHLNAIREYIQTTKLSE